MNTGTLVAGPLSKIGRTELAQIPVPQATATHRPVPHHEIVEALVETLMMLHPQMRDLAQRLLALQNAAGKTSEPMEFAAFRVCESLRQPLCALAGVAGFRSLLSRALTLAKAEAPSLSAVQVAADGSLHGVDELRPETDTDQAREAGVILITQLARP
jgi:hypothetical protein